MSSSTNSSKPSALTPRGGTRAWRRIRAAILARDGFVCQWCGGVADSVDHLTPRGRGGGDEPENLVAACMRCNVGRRSSRAGRTPPLPVRYPSPRVPPPRKTGKVWEPFGKAP